MRGGAGEDGVIGARAGEQDGEADGGQHEEDGRPGGELGEEVGGSAWAEGGLRPLPAEGAGKISRAALLQQDDSDKNQAHDYVNNDYEPEQNLHVSKLLSNTRQAGIEGIFAA